LAVVSIALLLGLLLLVSANVALTAALILFVAALLWRMNRRAGRP
jgi:hypothetical protein